MASLDWSQCPAVESIPGKVSGAWVLRGTRMPVSVIFENLEAGANIDDIMEWFQGLDATRLRPLSNSLPAVLTRLLRLLLAADVGPLLTRVLLSLSVHFLKRHTVQTTAERGWDTLGKPRIAESRRGGWI